MKNANNIKSELILYAVLFAVSCINTYFIYGFLFIVLALNIGKGAEGFLKICIWFSLRQCFFVPGLSRITDTQQTVKLIIVAFCAIKIIISNRTEIPRYVYWIIAFCVSALFSCSFFGSYPIAGAIKVINFSIVFYAVLLAVESCKGYFDVGRYFYSIIRIVIVVSICCLPFSQTYLLGSAGMSFRGIWNHPNDFAVICAVFIALTLVFNENIKLWNIAEIVVALALIMASRARGGLVSAGLIMISYLFITKNRRNRLVIAFCLFALLLIAINTKLGNEVIEFFLKTATGFDTAFSSRNKIIETALYRYHSNPLFGRGLLISYLPGEKSYILFENGTEPGNIFYELLGGTGIVGVILFAIMCIVFFLRSRGENRIFVVVAIAASIAEVSFFSVNNYACLYYILIALSLIDDNEGMGRFGTEV